MARLEGAIIGRERARWVSPVNDLVDAILAHPDLHKPDREPKCVPGCRACAINEAIKPVIVLIEEL